MIDFGYGDRLLLADHMLREMARILRPGGIAGSEALEWIII
jgi:hypothetical protein